MMFVSVGETRLAGPDINTRALVVWLFSIHWPDRIYQQLG